MKEPAIKSFDAAETRSFAKGKFEVLEINGMTLGRATYEPGWKWSEHVGPLTGTPLCQVEHVGVVVAGAAMVAFADGREILLAAGDAFYIPPGPPGHDSWVVGDEPYVSLHLLGAGAYAQK